MVDLKYLRYQNFETQNFFKKLNNQHIEQKYAHKLSKKSLNVVLNDRIHTCAGRWKSMSDMVYPRAVLKPAIFGHPAQKA